MNMTSYRRRSKRMTGSTDVKVDRWPLRLLCTASPLGMNSWLWIEPVSWITPVRNIRNLSLVNAHTAKGHSIPRVWPTTDVSVVQDPPTIELSHYLAIFLGLHHSASHEVLGVLTEWKEGRKEGVHVCVGVTSQKMADTNNSAARSHEREKLLLIKTRKPKESQATSQPDS